MKNKYKLFISHSEADYPVALVVNKWIDKLFEGRILPYLAKKKGKAGDKWKQNIISELESSNALISIISNESIDSKWLTVEWSHFWFSNKPYFHFILDKDTTDKLISPMMDRNYLPIFEKDELHRDRDKIKRFFQAIEEESKVEFTYSLIDDFILDLEKAIARKEINIFKIFEDESKLLPISDLEKIKIGKYFYKHRKLEIVARIISEVVDDSIRHDFTRKILYDNKFKFETELHFIEKICIKIDRPLYLELIVFDLINVGDTSSKVLLRLIERLSKQNQGGLRRIIEHLFTEDKIENDLFYHISDNLTDYISMSRLLRFFMEQSTNTLDNFKYILNLCLSNKEKTKLIREMIDNKNCNNEEFVLLVNSINSNIERTNIIEGLIESLLYDCAVFSETINAIKNETNLTRIALTTIENNLEDKPFFETLIKRIANTTNLSKIGSVLIASGKHRDRSFTLVLEMISIDSNSGVLKLVSELNKKDIEFGEKIAEKFTTVDYK